MIAVRLCLGMTVGALEYRIVRRIGMASRAYAIGAAVAGWEPRVVKGRIQPVGG